jgi:hypothetical protein
MPRHASLYIRRGRQEDGSKPYVQQSFEKITNPNGLMNFIHNYGGFIFELFSDFRAMIPTSSLHIIQ